MSKTQAKHLLNLLVVGKTFTVMTKTQAKHLRSLELEPGVSACDLVERLEKDGAHPLHHSVIGE